MPFLAFWYIVMGSTIDAIVKSFMEAGRFRVIE